VANRDNTDIWLGILHTRTLVFIVRMVFESMSEEVKTFYFTDI